MRKKKTFCALWVYFLSLLFIAPVYSAPLHPFEQIAQDPKLFSKLEQIVQATIKKNFGKKASLPELKEAVWHHSVALFVTAKKKGQVRGCMGSLQAQQDNLVEEIQINLQKAFAQDPRHPPIAWEEVSEMEIYLTAVGAAQAVSSLASIDPLRDAVLIQNGSRQAVILAGEAKTQDYLLKFARAKAGLRPGESFQVYRLSTKVLKVSLP